MYRAAVFLVAMVATPGWAASVPPDRSATNYFGNSVVLRNTAGEIFEVLYYKPDRTYRVWQGGTWHDATWLTNNGQDSRIMCLTHGDPVKTYCHPMALDKKVGDRWRAGQPLMLDGHWVVADSKEAMDASGSHYWTGLEKGLVAPPKNVLPKDSPPPSVDLGPTRDRIVEPLIGNSVVARNKVGDILSISYFAADHSLRQWRRPATIGAGAGHWQTLSWLTNNGHDGTLLCTTEARDGGPVTDCFYVPKPHQVGDRWTPSPAGVTAQSDVTETLESGRVEPPSPG